MKAQQASIAQQAAQVARAGLPSGTLLYTAGERFTAGDRAAVAARAGTEAVVARRGASKELLALVAEQGTGRLDGLDLRGMSEVSGLAVVDDAPSQGLGSGVGDDDHVELLYGPTAVRAEGAASGSPRTLSPLTRELRALDQVRLSSPYITPI